MADRYPPINPRFPHFLHGGDYNPDQWLHAPEVIDEDFRLMEQAGCNTFSIGIFAWVQLEPEEGRYTFDWLDRIMDGLAKKGHGAVLATPSGAKPAWMSAKYPEIRRVNRQGQRDPHQFRHNHCFTSPVYRAKTAEINARLAQRYKDHPALAVWHVSNEYNGECFCELCWAAFRDWLRNRYGSLESLNQAWWTGFWSHTYTDWAQIDNIDPTVDGMALDWKRFVTHQTVDFMLNEMAPLKRFTPNVPVTTNFMGAFHGLDYWKLAARLDVVADDCYPSYHDRPEDWKLAAGVSFTHDMNRAMKGGRPFMLMESAPSATNWMAVPKLKRPGVHRLQALQAVAHGADTVQYFQWRKGRGGSEKFHGAVVDHVGHERTRVFGDVAEVGSILGKLGDVIGATSRPEVALINDWDARWALEASHGPRKEGKDYLPTCQAHYRAFWQMSVPVDVIDADCPLEGYRLVVAPMLYLLRPGMAKRLAEFVRNGGTLVATYLTGIVDQSNRCLLGGWPGDGLREVFGVWAEEIDALYDEDVQHVQPAQPGRAGLTGRYDARQYCDLIHAESAEVLAVYAEQFYAGRPALTVNAFGRGRAYYVASRNDDRFHSDFYKALAGELKLDRVLPADLPEGLTAQKRSYGREEFIFLLNFKPQQQAVELDGRSYADMLTGRQVSGRVTLEGYGSMVLRLK